ncbi:hypothetical protein CAPTEDRAFT_99289 [Capitella teleta]|uniref:Guanylate cyclase domain-containing protein n=1 Tax=Capitella teleta TaxID=283909 RepID=R7TE38_CAPTE|nr:hypothetical protein CAPTEDRAFT_99289 [Capitella teleta]|eukprot:ELT91994.1 hypothetical protein CAPTEDRAFT_99289 [Capitella teleta]
MEINSRALFREKRHTERLIREMLPTTIAYKMMKNAKIEAEYFESVTVFFSDIVDFVEISMVSSPYDVVAFLNGIYNLIDDRLQWFDVYKVETIGCVYMVVSGLPLRNGSRHASEIARMALDIMAETENLGVLHMPNRKILLRIGAHTGPVVGGVVGNKMPRFCLFGDTVNTASRMQTNGEARKIHISGATMEMLRGDERFTMSERGQVFIKGKGMMQTYWVDSMVTPANNSRMFRTHLNSPQDPASSDTVRQKGSHAC